MDDWQCVGLDGPSRDPMAIKRAYARRLRATRPDDDPEGYQALREAYDRLLAATKQAVHDLPAPCVPPVAEAEPQPPAPAIEIAPADLLPRAGPSPQHLCAQFVTGLQTRGPAAAEAALPGLMNELHALPLQAQDEASVRFADAVIAHRDLPAAVQVALRDHFGWLGDYRAARLLGPERADALTFTLADLVAPETDPAVLERFTDLKTVDRLVKQGHRARARLFATLADEAVRQQLATVESLTEGALHGQLGQPGRSLLAALDMTPQDQVQVASALGLSRTLRMVLLAGVIAAAMRFENIDLVLAVFCSGMFMGVGALVVSGVAWFAREAVHWRRQLAAGASGRFLHRLTRGHLGGAPNVGLLLMAAGAAAFWAQAGHDAPGWLVVAFSLTVAGSVLAVPDDVDATLVGLGALGYLALVLRGLPAAHAVLLAAWLFSGIPLLSNGRFQKLVDGGLTPPRALAAAVVGIPVAVAWLASWWGYRLVLWSMLVAAVAQMRPLPVNVAPPMLLLICISAAFYARNGALAAGRWLVERKK